MTFVFALMLAVIIVIVGRSIFKFLKNKSKVGQVISQYKTPRKWDKYVLSVLLVVWVVVVAMSFIQKQYEYLWIYFFWFVWTGELAYRSNSGLKIAEKGIMIYPEVILWEEVTSVVWEQNKKNQNFFMQVRYSRDLGIEKKYTRYFELKEEDKKEIEKQIKGKYKKKIQH